MIFAVFALLPLFCAWRWTLRAKRDLPLLPAWTDERLRANHRIIAARWPTIALSTITTLDAAWLVDRTAGLGVSAPYGWAPAAVFLCLSYASAFVALIALLDRKEIDAAAKVRLQEPAPPPILEAPEVLYQAPDAKHIEFVDTRRVRLRN